MGCHGPRKEHDLLKNVQILKELYCPKHPKNTSSEYSEYFKQIHPK